MRVICFNSNVSNLYNKIFVEKTNGMTFNRVIINRVRLYKNRSTVQGQAITVNCCTHVIGWAR